MFMYYEEGNAAASIAPDVYVVLDHDLGERGSYQFWVEGKPLDFALNVITPSSGTCDDEEKRALYARLGIAEYFLFQPDVQWARQRLWGYRLSGHEYAKAQPGPCGELVGERLGVAFRTEGAYSRVRKREAGEDYLWPSELRDQIRALKAKTSALNDEARAHQQRAETQMGARCEAEAETARLKELVDKLGVPSPNQD